MMSAMRIIATALLAAAALALSACGDDNDEPAAPTRAGFIAKTDAQCKVSNVRTKKLNEEGQRASSKAGSEKEVLSALAPILERGYGQVRDNAAAFQAVNPPPADAAKIERIRKLYDKQAELVRKLAAAAKAGDVAKFKELSAQQVTVLSSARDAASAYGFKECGSEKSDAT